MKYSRPVVEIEWYDAVTDFGWEDHTELDTTAEPVTTIGFLLAENEHSVIVASTVDKGRDQSNSRIKIPKGMIYSMKYLNVTYKKVKEKTDESTSIDTTK